MAKSPRERTDEIHRLVRKVSPVNGFLYPPRPLLLGYTLKLSGIIEIVNDRHFGIQGVVFRQVANHPLCGYAVGFDVQPAYFDVAAGRFQVTGQHFYDGGLARAIVPEQSNDLSLADLE